MAAALNDLGLDADLERVPIEDDAAHLPRFIRRPIDWRSLIGQTPPERDWAVSHWLGMGYVTLLAGQGGLGKTLIAQTFGTCLALGRGYIDYAPRPRRVLMLAGEDDADELWRRQLAICEWLGVGLDDIAENFICESYSNRDMTLADIAYGKLIATPFLTELREQIADYRAEYVFLDSAARVFGGNENDRHHVTQFITWLTGAAGSAGVCLLAHPSKAAGSEFSGSTAWEGSVRSRLYLGTELPDVRRDKDDPPPDENERYLARRKVNYTTRDWRKLIFQNGVLVPAMDEQRRLVSKPSGEFAQEIVLRAVRSLAQLGQHGNTSTASPYYLPRLAKKNGVLEGLSENEFAAHMRALVKSGRLTLQTVGKYSNRTDKLGLVVV
ncbi:MAG: AAA family ATPase [Steroidobacteraceae bacterium]|nr:AAA family ATPase [Steroidobacteraceae bacterium]